MPDWPIHIIVPLLALLIASKKEHQRYIFFLLPFAVIPDLDTLLTLHRALLHNIFIPLILVFSGWLFKEKRAVFVIASVYFASHVLLDMFAGGVVLFYPVYERMAFVNASLMMDRPHEFIWRLDYGFYEYSRDWKNAYGYISTSTGTLAFVFIFLACMCMVYRNRILKEEL